MSLTEAQRERLEAYVRPFYLDLDGVDGFGAVGRRRALARSLLGGGSIDADYLELLLLFHGTVRPLGSTAPGGRWWLSLRQHGIAESTLLRLAAGLGRWREAPHGREEEALHDAELLECVGVIACARRLWQAGRRRVDFERALSTLDAGPTPARFRTAEGRRLASRGAEAAREWLEGLRAAAADPAP